MGKWSRRLGYLALGLTALLGPFFITLALIDYFAANGRPWSSSTGKPIFQLIMKTSGNNWSRGDSKSQVSVQPTGLSLVAPPGEKSYGFRTDRLSSDRGRSYLVRYDINMMSGALILEVVDGNSQVVTRHPVLSGKRQVRFVAADNTFFVAFYNRGSSPASALIATLTILEE
jgi:hypothetical protein